MKLLIVSHTPHYRKDGRLVGWGPTVREIDYLARLFEEVTHLAPLHSEAAPDSSLPYDSPRVRVRLVSPAGGDGLWDKLDILWKAPGYVRTIGEELRKADVVHVRCPANISMLATMMLSLKAHPAKRWVKYAGNWRPQEADARSYRLQRWWLTRGLHRGVVTVNGSWPGDPPHVHSFLNPCLTDQELEEARRLAEEKRLTLPMRLLSVGRLEAEKGTARAIEVLARLCARGVAATLDLVGDGPARHAFESLAAARGLEDRVIFHGWLARPALAPLYGRAHVLVLPTDSEGWPKVLSEGMAYGVVPLSSRVSSIPQYLEEFRTGRAFAPDDVESMAAAIEWYAEHPDAWAEEAANGRAAAEKFSYRNYLHAVASLLDVPLPAQSTTEITPGYAAQGAAGNRIRPDGA